MNFLQFFEVFLQEGMLTVDIKDRFIEFLCIFKSIIEVIFNLYILFLQIIDERLILVIFFLTTIIVFALYLKGSLNFYVILFVFAYFFLIFDIFDVQIFIVLVGLGNL
jgi:hypothetical protein